MARRRAVQALYQWQQSGGNVQDIYHQFVADQEMDRVDVVYFKELLQGVPADLDALDSLLAPHLENRSVDELDVVERAVLRIGAYELKHRLEIPYRVVINEAVELAKVFGADQSHKYVNGVLDKVAKQVRKVEQEAGRPS